MVSKAQHDIRRKRQVLDYAAQHGNVRKTCRHFGIPPLPVLPLAGRAYA